MSNFLLQCSARKLSNSDCYKFQNQLGIKFINNLKSQNGVELNSNNDDKEIDNEDIEVSLEELCPKFIFEPNQEKKKKYWLQLIKHFEVFIKNLNNRLQEDNRNDFLKLSKLRIIKIIEYYRDKNTFDNFIPLDFSCCVPAYIRYLGDVWFYKQIYYHLTQESSLSVQGFQSYFNFWKLIAERDIKVFISSTLFGWVSYDDSIPDYGLSPMHKIANWQKGQELNSSLFTGEEKYEILLTTSTVHHVYGYLDIKYFKNDQTNLIEPNVRFAAGFKGLKERAEYFVNTVIPNAEDRAKYKTNNKGLNDYDDFEVDL